MISRRSFLSQAGLIAAAGAAAWWARDHILWPAPKLSLASGAQASGWLPFQLAEQGVAIIDVQVADEKVRALVDSGAQSSVIDKGLAERLGLPAAIAGPVIVAYGVSGGPQLGRAATFDLTLGELRLLGLRAALFDLSEIATASGRLFSVILGQDVLRTLVADFDFPGQRLTFQPAATYALPPGARAVPAELKGRELRVGVTLEGSPLQVVVDTGASGHLSLSTETAQAAGLFDGRPTGWVPSITFGGSGTDRLVTAKNLDFAGRTWRDVPVHVFDSSGSRAPPGLLGVAALEDDRVVLNLAQGRLHLV